MKALEKLKQMIEIVDKEALGNLPKDCWNTDSLLEAFVWEDTVEGYIYWRDINDKLCERFEQYRN